MKKLLFYFAIFVFGSIPGTCFPSRTLPDSLLSLEKAFTYNIDSVELSLQIVHTLRDRQMEPEWRLFLAEGDIFRNVGRYHRAIDCYRKALALREVEGDYELQAKAWRRMMNSHDFLIDEMALMDDIYHLRQCSEKCGKKGYAALADFVMGKRMHMHNEKAEGFRMCQEAVQTIHQEEMDGKEDALRYCYVMLAKMCQLDHRYEQAMQMANKAEKLIKMPISSMETSCGTNHWLHYLYAVKTTIQSENGDLKEADKIYEQWKALKQDNISASMEIVPYLLISERPDEVLDIVDRYKTYLKSEGDSIEFRMLRALIFESHALSMKGDYAEVVECVHGISRLSVELFQEISRKEMNARHDSLVEKDSLHRRSMWMLGIVLVLLAMLIVACVVLWYSRRTYQYNLKLQRAMNRVKAYQKAVIKADEEAEKMMAMLPQDAETTAADNKPVDVASAVKAAVVAETDDDELLYVLLDKQMTRRQLFLNPNLSREDLMRLIGVDKNRIGRLMSKYSGASNVSTYINQKRAVYAAEYIKKHPDHTIAAVVEACGMTNAVTLNRSFKEVYGVSPSVYRQKVINGEDLSALDHEL